MCVFEWFLLENKKIGFSFLKFCKKKVSISGFSSFQSVIFEWLTVLAISKSIFDSSIIQKQFFLFLAIKFSKLWMKTQSNAVLSIFPFCFTMICSVSLSLHISSGGGSFASTYKLWAGEPREAPKESRKPWWWIASSAYKYEVLPDLCIIQP